MDSFVCGSDRGVFSSWWGIFFGGSDYVLLYLYSSKSFYVEIVDELFFYKWDFFIVFIEGY